MPTSAQGPGSVPRDGDPERASTRPIALITGGSRGLGLALCRSLAADGWSLVIDGRDPAVLESARRQLSVGAAEVVALAGDVADPHHRQALVQAAVAMGGLDVLVNNASTLGPSPLPALAALSLRALSEVFAVNVLGPLGMVQEALPLLRASKGRVLNVTSDAAVEAYPGWGGYGSSKAALEQLTRVLAQEEPDVRFYAVDPGDLRTDMHQAAFPGEDISDRPLPEVAVPGLRALMEGDREGGRYQAQVVAQEVQR
jgi:NAD(P)-dependent dehydrogenase (short-subunit alcohol dehydrogenase family)